MYMPTNPPTMRQFFQKVIAHHIDKNLTEVAKLQLEKMDWRNERSKEYHQRKACRPKQAKDSTVLTGKGLQLYK